MNIKRRVSNLLKRDKYLYTVVASDWTGSRVKEVVLEEKAYDRADLEKKILSRMKRMGYGSKVTIAVAKKWKLDKDVY
jgi:hypothetical protein